MEGGGAPDWFVGGGGRDATGAGGGRAGIGGGRGAPPPATPPPPRGRPLVDNLLCLWTKGEEIADNPSSPENP